jgi:hypothetical protein
MNEGGRIVGGCCVDKRAMAPILESYGRQRRDQNVRERFPASSDNQNELFAMTIAASDSNQAQIYNQNQ